MSVTRDRRHWTPKVVFLPGVSGDRDFWAPVANQLPRGWQTTLLNWPGAGDQPHDRHVLTAGAHTLARDRPDEVARLVIDHLERPIPA